MLNLNPRSFTKGSTGTRLWVLSAYSAPMTRERRIQRFTRAVYQAQSGDAIDCAADAEPITVVSAPPLGDAESAFCGTGAISSGTIGRAKDGAIFRAAEVPIRSWRFLYQTRTLVVALIALVVLAGLGVLRIMTSHSVTPDGTLVLAPADEASLTHSTIDNGASTGEQAPSDDTASELATLSQDYGYQRDQVATGNTSELVTIYITGAVHRPGIVHITSGARLYEAIDMAGGLTEHANPASVNLARTIVDGEHIVVAAHGETVIPTVGSPHQAGSAQIPNTCVDLNTADAETLQELDGIGPALAERIVTYRTTHGPFTSLSDVDAIAGIGPALIARIGAGTCQQ